MVARTLELEARVSNVWAFLSELEFRITAQSILPLTTIKSIQFGFSGNLWTLSVFFFWQHLCPITKLVQFVALSKKGLWIVIIVVWIWNSDSHVTIILQKLIMVHPITEIIIWAEIFQRFDWFIASLFPCNSSIV